MRRKALSIFLVLAILMIGGYSTTKTASAAVTITNGDFETGDLTGWTFSTSQPSGNAAAIVTSEYQESVATKPAYTITPDLTNNPGNTYFALLSPSLPGVYTILSQPFSAAAGDWISGEANFGSEDYLPYNDNAQVNILDSNGNIVQTVFSSSSGTIGGVRKTGWINWGYQVTASGTYAVQAQVANVGDDMRSSILALDNVSNISETAPYSLNLPVIGSGTVTATVGSTTYPSGSTFPAGTIVNLTAAPAPGSNFAGFSGSALSSSLTTSVTMNSNKTVLAAFMPVMCTLTLTASGSGTVSATANGQTISSGSTLPWGTPVTLSAVPDPGWSFSSWSGGISGISPQPSITLTSDLTANATFTQNSYTLNVTTSGSGSVSLNNQGPYHYGDIVQLTAIPVTGSSFSGWGGYLSGTANPAYVTINNNTSVTATFLANPPSYYTFSVNVTGSGSVTATNAQNQIIANGSSVASGSIITLTPSPAVGWSFGAWSTNVSNNQISITGNTTVAANFTQNLYTLTINASGSGTGSVSLNNNGPYRYGDSVQLTAVPTAGSFFSGWSNGLTGTANPASVTISDNTIVDASFTLNPASQYTLAINIAGSGTVSSNPSSATYSSGTSVTLTAVPAAGWSFSGWTGDVISNYQSISVTVNTNKAVTANFTQNAANTFTVSLNNTGSGTTGISAGGISYPSGSAFTSGTQITLTATPASGWGFGNWSGGISGTANPIPVIVNGNLTITANFVLNSYSLAVLTNGSGTVTGNYAQSYSSGTALALMAVPAPGWVFTSWTGDASGSNPALTVTMNGNKTITANFSALGVTAGSSPSPSVFGQTVTVTATITGPFTAGDTVTFMDGSTVLGTGTLNNSGTASYSTSAMAVGNHTLTAVYSAAASPAVTQVVNKAATTTGVSSSLNAGLYNFTASVNANLPGQGIPSGVVVFLDGNTSLGSATLSLSGQAVLAPATLAPGTHTITAQYGGDGNFNSSNGSAAPITVEASSSITITSSANPSIFGGSVTFTAAVTGSSGTPTGTVTFSDGSTLLGTISLTGGTAAYSTSTLAAGSHTITAAYSGDNSYYSSSNTLAQSVTQAATTTTLSSSPNPSQVGQSVTFNAGVTAAASAGVPAGSITFYDGATVLGVTVLNSSGQAALQTSTLVQGTHIIKAVYSGGANFSVSTSSPLTQTVNSSCTRGYSLRLLKSDGGTVSVQPAQKMYPAGTQVTVTATANPGYVFYRWDGNLKGSTNPATLTLNSDKTVKAVFKSTKAGQNYTLTTSVTGQGSVSVSPELPTYVKNAVVTLTATAASGYTFSVWQGDLSGSANPATLTMTGSDTTKTVIAVFVLSNPNPQGNLIVTKMMINWQNTDNQNGKPGNDDGDKDDEQNGNGGNNPGSGWNWDNNHGGSSGDNNQSNNLSLFQAWGQFQLPAGTKLADLKSAATVTLTIHNSSNSDSQTFEKVQSTGDGTFWLHNSNEKNPAGGMDNTYINISWAPDKSNWRGSAGFHIKGIFQLPDKTIGGNTTPAEATLTITIPLNKGNGSISESRTVSFKVNANQNLWQYNSSGPDKFPYNLDAEN